MRCRIILPMIGLLLFALEAWESNRDWRARPSPSRHFWWASIRLDSDPLNRDPRSREGGENGAGWNGPLKIVDPGYLAIASLFSGLPAFLVSIVVTAALGRFGISRVWTFMISTPILLFSWYYFLGWPLDRRRRKPKRAFVNT